MLLEGLTTIVTVPNHTVAPDYCSQGARDTVTPCNSSLAASRHRDALAPPGLSIYEPSPIYIHVCVYFLARNMKCLSDEQPHSVGYKYSCQLFNPGHQGGRI